MQHSGDIDPQLRSQRFLRGRGVAAVGIAVAGILSACSGEVGEYKPDNVPRVETTFCPSEMPNCTADNSLMSFVTGNSITVTEIPPICQEDTDIVYDFSTQVSPFLITAVFAGEDRRHCQRDGTDWTELFQAFVQGRGGSSIVMMNARHSLTGVPSDVYRRKWWEANVGAPALYESQSKEQQLLDFFNIHYMGRGSYGVAQASEIFLGKNVKDLNMLEAATIVALYQSPDGYDGDKDPKENDKQMASLQNRRDEIIRDIFETGEFARVYGKYDTAGNLINQSELIDKFLAMINTPADTYVHSYQTLTQNGDSRNAESIGAQYAIREAEIEARNLIKENGLDFNEEQQKGMKINTSISVRDHQALNKAYQKADAAYQHGQFGAFTVDEDGRVTAYIPSPFKGDDPYIDILQSAIVTGSGDKFYYVATLLELESGNKYDINMPLLDATSFTWNNYNGKGEDYSLSDAGARCNPGGMCSLGDLLANSANAGLFIPVRDETIAGTPILDITDQAMETYGMHSDSPAVPSNLVGTRETTPFLRGLGAVQLLGRSGLSLDSGSLGTFVDEIILSDGRRITHKKNPSEISQVYLESTSRQIVEALRNGARYGTSSRLSEMLEITDIAAKTGSHEDGMMAAINVVYCDSYDGYTGNKATGVIIRDPNGVTTPLPDISGGRQPAQLIHDYITNLSEYSADSGWKIQRCSID